MLRTMLAVALVAIVASPAWAEETEKERKMREMQEKLNQEVLSAPFNAEIEQKATAEIDEYLKSGKKPPTPYWGNRWRPGWSCSNLYRYGYRYYRDCRWYHRVHGRYY